MTDTHFHGTKLKQTFFQECKLDRADFTNVLLKGIDFTTSSFSQIQVSMDQLEGCKVNVLQAIGLSKLLGIVIQEDE